MMLMQQMKLVSTDTDKQMQQEATPHSTKMLQPTVSSQYMKQDANKATDAPIYKDANRY